MDINKISKTGDELYWTIYCEITNEDTKSYILDELYNLNNKRVRLNIDYKEIEFDICDVYDIYYRKDNRLETIKVCDLISPLMINMLNRSISDRRYKFQIQLGIVYIIENKLKFKIRIGGN